MNYEIVEMLQFSGGEAKIYSIILKGENVTLFEKFVEEHIGEFKNEIKDIVKRLRVIGHQTGARSSYFKLHEGKYGDFICALFDVPNKNLRLYCIRFGMNTVILGGGGEKAKKLKAWQEDEKLSKEANLMISCANDLFERMESGDIYWSKDKRELEGNLKNHEDE